MNLRRLPPSMLLALGLACTTDDSSTGSTGVSSGPGSETGGTTGTTGNGSVSATSTTGRTTGTTSSTSCLDVSACLDVVDGPGVFDIGRPETTTGPCLEPPSDSGSGSSSGSEGSSSESGTTTVPCLTPPGVQPDDSPAWDEPGSRRVVLERVLERGTLPPDVAARLRDRRDAR